MNIIEDNKEKLNKFKLNQPNPSYIAGFIDGDGTIFIRKINDGYQSGISLSQSRTNILQILQYHYGGTIIKPSNIYLDNIFNEDGYYDKNNKRNSYTLMIRSNEYKYILDNIYKYIILKKNQIDALLEFSQIVNKIDKKNEKDKLFNICSDTNKNKELDYYDYSRINIEYIQGLFDAEGHIFITYQKNNEKVIFNKGVYMKITQKNHPNIIDKIHNFLGFGKKSDYIYYVDNFDDCLKLIELLKPNLIVKYNQIIAFEEYIKTKLKKNEKYNEEIHLKREKIYKIINMEKHQIEIYEESIFNKDSLNIKIEKDSKDKNIQKEIKKKEFYLSKSELMKGDNNPNYGHHLDDSHALNISISTTNSKRANNPNLTNEKIREIYALKDTGIMQKDVAEKYSMNREMIRRIWNKIILPTDDTDFIIKKEELIKSNKNENTSNITFEQKTSIGKRNLNIDQYIEIILWKEKQKNNEKLQDKKIFSTTLSAYLSNLWNEKVTNDMVKNIWSGRTELFQFEFNGKNINYEKYLEIINKNSVTT